MASSPTFTATIDRIVERTSDTRSFFLRVDNGQKIPFVPGQFLSFLLPIDGKTVTRAYTIASSTEGNEDLEICLNQIVDGPGSTYLFSRNEGDVAQFTGPWGTFVLNRPIETEYVFIADRVGVVPFRSMTARVFTAERKNTVQLVYGAPRERDFLYMDEWRAWERRYPQFSFCPLTNVGAEGYSIEGTLLPYIAQHFTEDMEDAEASNRQFYICGIGRPTLLIRDLLRGAGYARDRVKYEKW